MPEFLSSFLGAPLALMLLASLILIASAALVTESWRRVNLQKRPVPFDGLMAAGAGVGLFLLALMAITVGEAGAAVLLAAANILQGCSYWIARRSTSSACYDWDADPPVPH